MIVGELKSIATCEKVEKNDSEYSECIMESLNPFYLL